MNYNKVVLVDEQDNPLGVMDKIEAHQKGLLHRAVSVFIFDTQGRWLLQRRSLTKYHCAGQWSNTCCSHPLEGEDYPQAAQRRLQEEMGMEVTLTKLLEFIYESEVGNGLSEHEFDTVFVGYTDQDPQINPEEVMEYKWFEPYELKGLMIEHPDWFTPWFIKLYRRVVHEIA